MFKSLWSASRIEVLAKRLVVLSSGGENECNSIVAQRMLRAGNGGVVGGGGWVSSRVHEQQFCVSRVNKQIVYLIKATCMGDLRVALNSLGKPAVGGQDLQALKLHQTERLKSEVKSRRQMAFFFRPN